MFSTKRVKYVNFFKVVADQQYCLCYCINYHQGDNSYVCVALHALFCNHKTAQDCLKKRKNIAELVFTELILQILYHGFKKLLFTAASLYWIYPLVYRFMKSIVLHFGGALGCLHSLFACLGKCRNV
jgi:hypothetical protein